MNPQDFKSIQEAYSQVYELDEAGTATGPRLTDDYDKPPYSDDIKSKPLKKGPKMKGVVRKEEVDLYDVILSHLLDEGYADTQEAAEAIMVNMSEDWRESIVEGIVDKVASTAGSVVGTVQRAAREVPKYVQQKVNNVAGSYEYARQKADNNSSSGSTKMTTAKNATMSGKSSAPRSREFSHGGKPGMPNPGPNFGR
jgi:hypothetical protein